MKLSSHDAKGTCQQHIHPHDLAVPRIDSGSQPGKLLNETHVAHSPLVSQHCSTPSPSENDSQLRVLENAHFQRGMPTPRISLACFHFP